MVLSAVLKLDAAGFTTPLGMALEGMKAAIRIGGDLGRNLKQAFDTGGMLSDLAAQTGESAGDLMILKQAFEDTGVGGEALGQTLAMMRRSLAGISESGKPVKQIFNQLGLDIESIKGMGAREQLQTIAGAINNLRTPSEQSAASMEIFGRSGAKMLTMLKDPKALDAAAESLGGLPSLMSRNAAAFDAVSDRMGRIKQKGQGLWAGIAEGLLPLADQITATLDGIDLTGAGQRIGAFMGTMGEMFSVAADWWKEVFGVAIDWWSDKIKVAMEWWGENLPGLGKTLWNALSWPLSYFSAAIGKVIQETMELIGKIPKVGEKLGLKGFEAQSWEDILSDTQEDFAKMGPALGKYIMDAVKELETAGAQFTQTAKDSFLAKLAAITQAAAAPIGTGTAALTGAAAEDTGGGGSLQTLSDALTRIGGYTGGGMQDRLAAFTERTARATERMAGYLAAQRGGGMTPVWGA